MLSKRRARSWEGDRDASTTKPGATATSQPPSADGDASAHVESSVLYRAGDHAIVMTGEALKTIVREVWGLGGQVINGAAAAVLHITLEPGYNVNRRRRIEKHQDEAGAGASGAGAGARTRASSSDSGESGTASAAAPPARARGSSAASGASIDGAGEAQPQSWFGRLLSTATSLLEESDASGSDSGGAADTGSTRRDASATSDEARRVRLSPRLYGADAAAAATAAASRMTPRRLPPPAAGSVAGTGASGSGSRRGGSGGGAGGGGGTGHGSPTNVAKHGDRANAPAGSGTEVVPASPSRGKLSRLGSVLRVLSDRVLGLHSLVLPHSKLRLALPGSYSKLLAQQLLSLQPRKALGHQADGRTGLVEDLHMHLLVAIDNATAYTRKLYRVVVTWVPLVGLPRGAAAMLATPVSAFPLLRRITSPPMSRTGSHSAGLIQGVCGYPVECVPVTTADGYHIHMVRIPRRGSTKCAFFQHGLLDSASAWVSNGNVFSLGCRAWESGFDVFLGNFRGTDDSMTPAHHDQRRRHERYTPKDSAFWEYSVDDHVLDVIAFIHAIRKMKRNEFRNRATRARRRHRASSAGNAAAAARRVSPRNARAGAGGAGAGAGGAAGVGPTSSSARELGGSKKSWLPSLHITGLGHSMGGAVLLLYALHCRALRIPHGLDRMVLLSPAGSHVEVPLLPKAIVSGLYHTLKPVSNAPFPMRSSRVQRAGAKLLQDLKRSPATVDFMASVATCFFGGTSVRFPFQNVHFTDYPLGGSSVKVLRHGVQVMWAKDFCAFDYGRGGNLRRYGTELPPMYRDYFHLIDLPVHFMAGTRDVLIPPANIHIYNAHINAAAPGCSTVSEFDMGHLDFTLGLDDGQINHVLQQLRSAIPDQFAGTDRHTPRADWIPAREAAKLSPFLFGYSKLDEALAGLDRMSAEAAELAAQDLGMPSDAASARA